MAARKGRTAAAKKDDAYVRAIRDTLLREYLPTHPKAKVDVYRYNPASVRVRIIDPGFAGRDRVDRDAHVWELLERHLPEDTYAEINLLLLLTPGEVKRSLMNLEFEDPTPSSL